ncbi:MAG: hypothetical protein RIT81_14420 [Deltaproteobacteria bacterium]
MIRGQLPAELESNLPLIAVGLNALFTTGLFILALVDPGSVPGAEHFLPALGIRAVLFGTAFLGVYQQPFWGRGFAVGVMICQFIPGPGRFDVASFGVLAFGLIPLLGLDIYGTLLLLDRVAARRFELRPDFLAGSGLTRDGARSWFYTALALALLAGVALSSRVGVVLLEGVPAAWIVVLLLCALSFAGLVIRAKMTRPLLWCAGLLTVGALVWLRVGAVVGSALVALFFAGRRYWRRRP